MKINPKDLVGKTIRVTYSRYEGEDIYHVLRITSKGYIIIKRPRQDEFEITNIWFNDGKTIEVINYTPVLNATYNPIYLPDENRNPSPVFNVILLSGRDRQ